MNPDFPVLVLPKPIREQRRAERPRFVPLPPELVQRRSEVARVLGVKISSLSARLKKMSEEERKAVFYKLEHDQKVSLAGTGLKEVVQPTPNITIAVPRGDDLDSLKQKLDAFGSDPLKRGQPPNATLGHLTDIREAEPTDRLSEDLFSQYKQLIKKHYVICEVELISLKQGKNQQRGEIQEILRELESAFASGVHGNLFEHEEIKGTCRVVIRCTGAMFENSSKKRSGKPKSVGLKRNPSSLPFKPSGETSMSAIWHLSRGQTQILHSCALSTRA